MDIGLYFWNFVSLGMLISKYFHNNGIIFNKGERMYKKILIGLLCCIDLFAVDPIINEAINLNNGLVAHYEFEDNPGDSSGNEHNGIKYGQVSYVEGVMGKAINFNGTYQNYIRIPHNNSLNINGNYSFSYWVNKGEETGSTQVLFSKGRDCRNSYFASGAGGSFTLGYGNSWCDGKGLYKSFLAHEWHMVTILIDNTSNKLKYFLDGNFEEEIIIPTYSTSNNYDLVIGRHDTFNNGSSSWAYPFNGKLDDFRIYDRLLTNTEIQELYGSNSSQIDPLSFNDISFNTNSLAVSEDATISGLSTSATISVDTDISFAQLQINNGVWTTSGNISNNDIVRVRTLTPNNIIAVVSVTVSVNDYTTSFEVSSSGVTPLDTDQDKSCFQRVDKALYQAKIKRNDVIEL